MEVARGGWMYRFCWVYTWIIFVLPVAHLLYAALRVCLLVCLGSTRCSSNSRGFEVGFGARKSRLVLP